MYRGSLPSGLQVLVAKNGRRGIRMITGECHLLPQRYHSPERLRTTLEPMELRPQLLGTEHTQHGESQLLHLFSGPPREMFLQVVSFLMALWQKAVGGEEDNPLLSDTLHRSDQLETILLGQVFDNVQCHAGIKLFGFKNVGKLPDITHHEFRVSLGFAGVVDGRLVAIDPHGLRQTEVLQRGGAAAAHIEYLWAVEEQSANLEDIHHHEWIENPASK